VLLTAVALKYFYSTANVNQLRWSLAPTTIAVEFITGQRFHFEPYAGYINSHHTFVVAASCAGVNFLLTAFLMLALGKLWRNRSRQVSWTLLPVAALVAYVATLIANAIRITTSIQLREMRIESDWLNAGQLHRFEGIFIYFGFLLLLYVISDRLSNAAPAVSAEDRLERRRLACGAWRPTRKMQPRTVALQSLGQRCLFPLLIYYGTTLGLPLINGAFRQTGFWEHSLFVLLIPLVFVIPFAGFVFMRNIRRAVKHT
jgi:exosortase K